MKNVIKKIGNGFKFAWKNNKVFLIVTTAVLVLVLSINILLTSVQLFYSTFNTLFGGERKKLISGDPAQYQRYKTDEGISSKSDALKYANSVNEELAEEGFTLLKNDSSLPLSKSAKISVFGMNSVNLVYGGSGSGAKSSSNVIDLYKSLDNANISYNAKLKNFYNSKSSKARPAKIFAMGSVPTGLSTYELPLSDYDGGSIGGYIDDYKDAALVVISRIGGEGYDLPRTSYASNNKDMVKNGAIAGRNDETEHYLEIDNNEKALLLAVCAANSGFSNVILIINSATSMELGFLDDAQYNNKLKGAIWVGTPGATGMNALGKILIGDINPSGHTVDTYAKDFTKDPTWNNFARNFKADGNQYTVNSANTEARFVDYEEGIYVGYRYWETAAFEASQGNYPGFNYNDSVMFPFGYGLSYSEFEWTLGEAKLVSETGAESDLPATLLSSDRNKKIKIEVSVKNKSAIYAGKDVVQVYVSAPYNAGGIEKAHVVLCGFDKIVVPAGGTKTATILINISDLASYDYKTAKKFTLDSGTYKLLIGTNAHDAWANSTMNIAFDIANKISYNSDFATGNEVTNRFDSVNEHVDTVWDKRMSRSDFVSTFPTTPTDADRDVPQALIDSMTVEAYLGKGDDYDADKKWTADSYPTQASRPMKQNETTVKLYDLVGKPYIDDEDDTSGKTWEALLNQLTLSEMSFLIGTGNFNTARIDSIDKPATIDPDGPAGFTQFMSLTGAEVYDTCFYASECVIGATWNKQLAEKMGYAIGNESLIGKISDGLSTPYSGWYAPAVNIHRSPFSGRNWEYYSEDGLLSGKIAAGVIKGAKAKGVYTYVKHFAVNDQETDRDNGGLKHYGGLITWVSEQTMREIYLKPFEIAVKEGKSSAIMTSFNRIGTVWAGGSYELLTEILRNEWGFEGMVISDFSTGNYMDTDQMIRAGGDLQLYQDKKPSTDISTTQVQSIRKAAKNILYTVANSNAMNGYGDGVKYGTAMPMWQVFMLLIDMFVVILLAVFGFFSIRRSVKSQKAVKVES